jgi:hypothetical protein
MPKEPKRLLVTRKHPKRERGLTPLERAYVIELTREDADRPKSMADAFFKAGGCPNGTKATIRTDATMIANRPIVREAIRVAHERNDNERMRRRRTARATIENALWEEHRIAVRPADRLAALKTLAQMAPAEDKHVAPEKDAATAIGKQAILSRIEGIMTEAGGDPLDVTPVSSVVDADDDTADDEGVSSYELGEDTDDTLPAVIDVESVAID